MAMKKLVCFLAFLILTMLCAVALAKPPLPPKAPYLKDKLIITDDLSKNDSYLNWLIKDKMAPNEYFALAFLKSPGNSKDATIVTIYSEDGLTWKKPLMIPLKGKDPKAVKGVDLTHHNWGILQGFAYDFKSSEIDRLFWLKLASGLELNSAPPGFPVSNVGPPATIILPSGDQLLACNVQGEMSLLKGKLDNATGFKKVILNKICDSAVAGRPGITFKKNKMLLAWRVAGKGIWTALYGISPLGRLEFIKCKLALISGATQPGDDHVYEIKSDPVLADCDESFYIGVASKRQDEPKAKFRIFRSADAVNWKLVHTLDGASSPQSKLGLAAKYDGTLLAAVIETSNASIKKNAWLYHRNPKLIWQWTDLLMAPWVNVQPAVMDFGLDSGGVRR